MTATPNPDVAVAASAPNSLAALDPFKPPPDYAFEPELRDPPPRAIPQFDRPGRLERGRRQAFAGLLTAGVLCMALAPLPVVRAMGLYFLPLGWLTWIGIGCIVLAILSGVRRFVLTGPYRQVQDGRPLVARVLELVKAPVSVVNGEPNQHAFAAAIEFRHPDTGDLAYSVVRSRPFSSAVKDQYTTSYRVGDYATALYLPNRLDGTIQLYGFLDLNPDIGLRRRDGTLERSDLWKLPLLVGTIAGFFAVLFWNVYAFGRFEPLDFDYRQAVVPMAVGGTVLGSAMLALLYLEHRRRMRKIEEHNRAALFSGEAIEVGASVVAARGVSGWFLKLVLLVGAPLLGAATTLCWCFSFNALADGSPGQLEPVHIKEFWQTTHSGIFREYTIEYSFLANRGETHKLMTNPSHMSTFGGPLGLAEIHDGRLGWKWVKTIHPARSDDDEVE